MPLRLGEEVREIKAGLQRSRHRERFELKSWFAVTPRDVQRAMLEEKPQIVHFCGQGGETGLVLEDESGEPKLVSTEALANLFRLFADQVECVLLNACYSEVQAGAIAQHIPYVIGMSEAIGDKAAIEFAIGFYDALGAGRDVEFAYDLGCSSIQLAGIAQHLIPVLKKTEISIVGKADSAVLKITNVPSQPTSSILSLSTYSFETWVGRDDLADTLETKLKGQCRLLMLTGLTGIGKTALAEYLAVRVIEEAKHSFYFCSLSTDEIQSTDFISGARLLLEEKLNISIPKEERNDATKLLHRLGQTFKDSSYWLQLDSLEALLIEDEQGGSLFSDETWLKFFRQFLTTDSASRCILTSQVLPADLEATASRYPNFWQVQALPGLTKDEQFALFQKNLASGLETQDPETIAILQQIGQSYEGHPLVLQVIAGEIIAPPFRGNIKRYWQQYQTELTAVLQERSQPSRSNMRSRRLENQVRKRVKHSLEQLSDSAQQMLFQSSVYRRPVPNTFWWAMVEDEEQAQLAFDILRDRNLIEFEESESFSLLRQHNLIRSVAYELLKANPTRWLTAERTAAQRWLNNYEPTPSLANLEKIRGYLEAYQHYCNTEDWKLAIDIPFTPIGIIKKEQLHRQLGVWGYYQEQIKLYDSLLIIFRITCEREGEGFALGHLGNVYSDLGNYGGAIEYYQQHLEIIRELKLRRDEGVTLGNLGTAYQALHNYPMAIEYYQQALTIVQEMSDRLAEGTMLDNLGSLYRTFGNYQQALDYHQQSLTIARELHERGSEQSALSNLGTVHYFLGNYQQALDYHQQSVVIAQETGSRKGEARALNGRGMVHHAWGNYKQATEDQQQALILFRDIGDRQGEGVALGNLGFVLYFLKNYELATEFFQHGLTIAREIGNRQGEATMLGNLGRVLCDLKEYENAIEYQQKRLAIAEEIGDRRNEGNGKLYLGIALTRLGQFTEALEALQSALEICRAIENKSGEAEALLELAALQCSLGYPQLAQSLCEESLKIAETLQIPLVKNCMVLLEQLILNGSGSTGSSDGA
ncbi:MAG TPA: tetratricopeptide repeat protein [Coleofasciculaceae cyanobacterium]